MDPRLVCRRTVACSRRRLAIVAVTDTERALIVAGIAATATLLVALLSARFAFIAARRDRRRQLYGEATKAATVWVELLYRVRRRADNTDDARAIIQRFHEAQEALMYHRGWMGSESRYVARSYDRLVDAVKGETEPLVQAAWKGQLRRVPGDAWPTDRHPDIERALGSWLKDVRGHLTWRPFAKIGFLWRNLTDA